MDLIDRATRSIPSPVTLDLFTTCASPGFGRGSQEMSRK
jgi:hypothetical protein